MTTELHSFGQLLYPTGMGLMPDWDRAGAGAHAGAFKLLLLLALNQQKIRIREENRNFQGVPNRDALAVPVQADTG